jgi:hypothetical protein
MDSQTWTGAKIKIPGKGVPRSTPGIEKVRGKNQQSKEVNPDRLKGPYYNSGFITCLGTHWK